MKLLSRALFFLCFLASTGALAVEKIDINTASLAQLDELTGIGPKYAQAIIDARPFSSVDDLLRVSGIGEITLQKIKTQGLACVDCQTTQEISNSQLPISNESQNLNDLNATETETPKAYPTGILLNEILPSPEGADETNEWIEIFNQNDFSVDLSGWQISDMVGSTKTYTLPVGTKIIPQGYLVIDRPTSKIVLNNDADGIKLIQPDGKAADEVSYKKAPLNESYNRTEKTDWLWSSSLTPGLKNIMETESTPAPTQENSEADKKETNALADISQTLESNQGMPLPKSSVIIFLTAAVLAIFSGIIIFFLKRKIKKSYN